MYSQQLNGLHTATDVIMQKHNSQIIPADYIHCGNSYWYKIGATSQMKEYDAKKKRKWQSRQYTTTIHPLDEPAGGWERYEGTLSY